MKRNIYNQQPRVEIMTQAQRQAIRAKRTPVHQFQLVQRPFEIQPTFIAPVLAGETLKSAVMQKRAVTDPLLNKLTGWWSEDFIFYVKLRDLDVTEAEGMLLDQSNPWASDGTADTNTFHSTSGGTNFTKRCRDLIVKEYFTDQGYTLAEGRGLIDGIPITKAMQTAFWESIQDTSVLEALGDGVTVTTSGSTDVIEMDEFQGAYNTYLQLYGQQQQEITFEEYLGTFKKGLEKKTKLGRPELIRYWREWQYPSNTVNPTPVLDASDEVIIPAGQPTSAVSWAISGRVDKPRAFDEPGFLVGISVFRPKVYVQQSSAAAHMLRYCFDWQPALLADKQGITIKKFTQQTGPLGGVYNGNGYAIDTKDLFLYGDQFTNYSLGDPDRPTPSMAWDGAYGNGEAGYCQEADIDRPFVDPNFNKVWQDGTISLTIDGRAGVDYT